MELMTGTRRNAYGADRGVMAPHILLLLVLHKAQQKEYRDRNQNRQKRIGCAPFATVRNLMVFHVAPQLEKTQCANGFEPI